MDEAEFKKYHFLRLYLIDLDTALHNIKVIKRYRRDDVRYPILRDIVVAYVRPFSSNKGNKISSHALKSSVHVPKSMRELHEELVRARKEQFAHTDERYYKPKVVKIKGQFRPMFPMTFKSYNYTALMKRIDDIKELIVAVERSIRAEADEYETIL